MRRRAASWYGESMTAPGPSVRSAKTAPNPCASVTLLGATGSIGSSTVDLIRRGNGRYHVEAVTAHRNAAALAKLARELEGALCGGRGSGGL